MMKVWRVALFTTCIVMGTAAAPAMSFDGLKAANACRALVVDSTSAVNLRRPPALRYRAAPLRVCVPDDTNNFHARTYA
jgi:hypothetical protein